MTTPDKKDELWHLFEQTGDISVYIDYASLKISKNEKNINELNKRIS